MRRRVDHDGAEVVAVVAGRRPLVGGVDRGAVGRVGIAAVGRDRDVDVGGREVVHRQVVHTGRPTELVVTRLPLPVDAEHLRADRVGRRGEGVPVRSLVGGEVGQREAGDRDVVVAGAVGRVGVGAGRDVAVATTDAGTVGVGGAVVLIGQALGVEAAGVDRPDRAATGGYADRAGDVDVAVPVDGQGRLGAAGVGALVGEQRQPGREGVGGRWGARRRWRQGRPLAGCGGGAGEGGRAEGEGEAEGAAVRSRVGRVTGSLRSSAGRKACISPSLSRYGGKLLPSPSTDPGGESGAPAP